MDWDWISPGGLRYRAPYGANNDDNDDDDDDDDGPQRMQRNHALRT